MLLSNSELSQCCEGAQPAVCPVCQPAHMQTLHCVQVVHPTHKCSLRVCGPHVQVRPMLVSPMNRCAHMRAVHLKAPAQGWFSWGMAGSSALPMWS